MSSIDAQTLAHNLRLGITRTARLLRKAAPEGVTQSQLSMMHAIDKNERPNVKTLAEVERVSPPSVVRSLDNLEAKNWIRRVRDSADRRLVHVEITDDGARMLAEFRTRRDAYLARRIEGLSEDDRIVLARAVELLADMASDEGDL